MFAKSRKSLGETPKVKTLKPVSKPKLPKTQDNTFTTWRTSDISTLTLNSNKPPRRKSATFIDSTFQSEPFTEKKTTKRRKLAAKGDFVEASLNEVIEKDPDVSWDEPKNVGFVVTPFKSSSKQKSGPLRSKRNSASEQLEEKTENNETATTLQQKRRKKNQENQEIKEKMITRKSSLENITHLSNSKAKRKRSLSSTSDASNEEVQQLKSPSNKKQNKNKSVKKTTESNKKLAPSLKIKKKRPISTQAAKTYDKSHPILAKSGLNPESIKKAVEQLIHFRETNPKIQNILFEEEFPLFLQLNLIKIPPNQGSRIIRLSITNSYINKDSDICLIVPDVVGLKKKDLDKQQEHYEEILKKHGIENIKKIMTFYELKTEYHTFEMKKKLADLYDYFLVDGRISGKVILKSGKIFYQKRKVATAVNMAASKLKDHITSKLSKTPLYYHTKGDSLNVQFGHSKMSSEELLINILDICQGMDKEVPGGFANLRSINIYSYRGISIPIYKSLKNPNDVIIVKPKEKKIEPVTDELSTRLNTTVTVYPTGEIVLHKQHKNRSSAGRTMFRKVEKKTNVKKQEKSKFNY